MSQTINDTTALLNSNHRYTRSGIGGAGNIRKNTSTPAVSSTPRIIPTPSKGTFLTGIGGAGNSRSYEERASISFEEALARDNFRKLSVAGSYHHGIGGMGNRSSVVDCSASSSVESNSFLSSAMAMQSGADRVKGRVVSFFGGSSSKRSSMVDEKDDVSTDGRSSWAKEN
ncbi:hypothetical protein ONS95_013439 [Cadophora gregata]|uniref:uncharacterized protein n=1 Tax=Cadophora gregata TaxID=51156 RepID=UPI0026DC469C|nr:uncharacterized protein ONS95_013439 [Cadophora gregata]KAK0099668.1 hypothetical protein ONS96_008164 [Cadophora gregata f. sp. sojae]KAK0116419.1 hypothetical protein ONS95_013439 [Cadophora gregata]